MWVTVDGERSLRDAEARLLCRALASMLSDVMARPTNQTDTDPDCWVSGIDWFDQWEVEQKVWLLERVATALLTDLASPKPAAMWEATVDAIFQYVFEQVLEELEQDALKDGEFDEVAGESVTVEPLVELPGRRWCEDVIETVKQQGSRDAKIERSADQGKAWRRLVMQIADHILGVAAYQTVESYRDGQSAKVVCFLQQKGLPADFLTQIPPLLVQHETEHCIQRLRTLIAQFEN